MIIRFNLPANHVGTAICREDLLRRLLRSYVRLIGPFLGGNAPGVSHGEVFIVGGAFRRLGILSPVISAGEDPKVMRLTRTQNITSRKPFFDLVCR